MSGECNHCGNDHTEGSCPYATPAQRDEANDVRPFHCGSQDADWTERNCWDCRKEWQEDAPTEWPCDIQKALQDAYWDNGTISAEIARRMGYTACDVYTWDCPEKEEK